MRPLTIAGISAPPPPRRVQAPASTDRLHIQSSSDSPPPRRPPPPLQGAGGTISCGCYFARENCGGGKFGHPCKSQSLHCFTHTLHCQSPPKSPGGNRTTFTFSPPPLVSTLEFAEMARHRESAHDSNMRLQTIDRSLVCGSSLPLKQLRGQPLRLREQLHEQTKGGLSQCFTSGLGRRYRTLMQRCTTHESLQGLCLGNTNSSTTAWWRPPDRVVCANEGVALRWRPGTALDRP